MFCYFVFSTQIFATLGEGFNNSIYNNVTSEQDTELDGLLFNVKLNCYIVVELKLRYLKKEDKAQMEYYMKLVDEQFREPYHNKTIGIIITKESDKLIVNFIKSEEIMPNFELIIINKR